LPSGLQVVDEPLRRAASRKVVKLEGGRAAHCRKGRKFSSAVKSTIFGDLLRGKELPEGVTLGSADSSRTPAQGGVEKSSQARWGCAPRAVEKGANFWSLVKSKSRLHDPADEKREENMSH
jgi:hypothetical protein